MFQIAALSLFFIFTTVLKGLFLFFSLTGVRLRLLFFDKFGCVSWSILLLCALSMQWPDISRKILDDPLLDVCLSWRDPCFNPTDYICGTIHYTSLYLWYFEFSHLLCHICNVRCLFALLILASEISGLWGRCFAFFDATLARLWAVSLSGIALCAGR